MSHKFFKGNVEASDIATGTVAAARLPALDGITAPAGNLAMNDKRITGLADPSGDNDAATKSFVTDSYLTTSSAASVYLTQSNAAGTYATTASVDSAIEGLDPKEICEAATTATLSLYGWSAGVFTESSATGALSIDGVTLANDDRVLVKDQSTKKQNGVYVCSNIDGSAAVILTRATDCDSVGGLVNAYTFVKTDGSTNGGVGFVQTTLTGSGTINTTNIEFTQFTSAATALTTEQVQDIVGAMVTSNTETNIAVTYQDGDGTIDFVATDTDTQLTQEQVEDFAGALIANSSGTHTGIAVTYQDSTGDMDLVVDHDTASNYVANEHIDWTASSSSNIHSGNYTDTNTQLSEEQVEDFVGGMLTGNTETGITATYQDADGTIDLVVGDITVAGDSGSTAMSIGDTLTIAGGTNVTTAQSSDTLTITLNDNPSISISTGEGSSNFLSASHTIPDTTAKQMYCYTTSSSDLTLTLPEVASGKAAQGTSIIVKLLSTGGGDVIVASNGSDKMDGSTSNVTLDVAGEAIRFTAMDDSSSSTTTWVLS